MSSLVRSIGVVEKTVWKIWHLSKLLTNDEKYYLDYWLYRIFSFDFSILWQRSEFRTIFKLQKTRQFVFSCGQKLYNANFLVVKHRYNQNIIYYIIIKAENLHHHILDCSKLKVFRLHFWRIIETPFS